MMNVNFKKIISTHYILIGILILSAVLRFYNYANRWGLAYDQARDVIVINEAILRHELPLIGPFSASGPFVFGPYWYWLNMVFVSLTPKWILMPWVIQGILSAFIPLLAYFIGKKISDQKLGMLFAFFVAISSAGIAQSTNLTYSTYTGFLSFITLFFAVKYLQTKRNLYLFITTVVIGIAINFHFQAIGLLFYIPILFFTKRPSIKSAMVIVIGFLLPFIPMGIFDLSSNHYQSTNLSKYFLFREGVQALPKRWLTHAFVTWPTIWATTIGGHIAISFIFMIGVVILTVKSFLKKRFNLSILVVTIFFAFNFIALRYYGGAIFNAFYVYLHPVILLLSAWVVWNLINYKKLLGIIFLILIAIFTISASYYDILKSTNFTAQNAHAYREILIKKYPNEKFAIYDYGLENGHASFSLVMFLQNAGLLDNNGRRIGVAVNSEKNLTYLNIHKQINSKNDLFPLYDLSASTSAILQRNAWAPVNPSYIYNSVQYWYRK